jgi:hypothetical protein
MKHASALILPETAPSHHIMAKLLIFFDSLSYYLPTESDPAGNRDTGFFANLYTPYAPAPLAEGELFRFNRLLREMVTSRPEELSRLFSAATAPLATGRIRDLDEVSAAGVYSSLQKNTETKNSIRNKERLWQARLILKLAEMLDSRETEVRQGLARISSSEQKLFAALEGHGEAESDDLAEIKGPDKLKHPATEDDLSPELSLGTSSLLTTLRLKAWAELYLADSSEQQPSVPVTANPECGMTLLDGYENFMHRVPVKLFSLPVPELHFSKDEKAANSYHADRKSFCAASLENKEYLAQHLHETAYSEKTERDSFEKPPELTENLSAWEENLRHYISAPVKTSKLGFYCFPGISFAGLLQHLFHLDDPVQNKSREQPTGMLAVLAP